MFKLEMIGVEGAVKCSNVITLTTLFCNKSNGLIRVSQVRPHTKIPYCRKGENKEL